MAQQNLALVSGPQDPSQINANQNSLLQQLAAVSGGAGYAYFAAPIAAELVSIKAAAIAAAGTITIAAQPDYPRKLQVRIVVVTPITVGTLTLVGVNAQGQTVTEVISLVQPSTITIQTANAYAKLTSGTVSALTGGGDGTLGIGVGTALGVPLPVNFSGFTVYRTNTDAANDTVGTVDTVAGTMIPNTAANATHNYHIWYTYNSGI